MPSPCPNYVVVSYTWGRWKHRNRDLDTTVPGGYWQIPANTLFSRQDLDFAIRKIAGEEYAWVDVFCIPQLDSDPLHGQEIGRQSEIFRSATRAAVWLCSGGDEVLAEICSWVPEGPTMMDPVTVPFPSLYEIKHGTADLEEFRRRAKLVASLTEAVPWTTSLWTLQEAALRLDAVFYDKKGEPIRHRGSNNAITINHLVKTLQYVNESLRIACGPNWEGGAWMSEEINTSILEPPESLPITEADVKLWLEAIDAVTRINLHKLNSMNASELLLTSTHRTCKRPHDRVYGIMGAIGVTIPVDYTMDPAKVMERFIVELHNTLPAEIQSFFRKPNRCPSQMAWLADESCYSLGLVRQGDSPSSRVFDSISPSGCLVVKYIHIISKAGLDDLASRFLGQRLAAGFDVVALSETSCGLVQPRGMGSGRSAYILTCVILRLLHSRMKLALVPLGSIVGLDRLMWKYMYLLLASDIKVEQLSPLRERSFRRIGVIFSGEELLLDEPASGEFSIR
ncbi:Uncharacterized protein PECH_003234 [Penicillium ucsense]|uniref:Heterokaryon incompatibility domain-containing protein n=1 Tax=Penicillium ucsense TaxID=2839758 RepID=A0A8J8WG69_9EURO|nr:Uncharacterized protein PECM_003188 [Penicillium ucsense]KAF7729790.1 Uncharacterized protein PECH_003234 [Penicillium ucsense]